MTNEQNPKNSGLRLERFSQSNADLVLKWRNDQHVRENSLSDDVIKHEDHLRFVESIKDRTDRNFFIVYVEGYPEAVLNVNSNDGVGSWGCYLGGGAHHASRHLSYADCHSRLSRFQRAFVARIAK